MLIQGMTGCLESPSVPGTWKCSGLEFLQSCRYFQLARTTPLDQLMLANVHFKIFKQGKKKKNWKNKGKVSMKSYVRFYLHYASHYITYGQVSGKLFYTWIEVTVNCIPYVHWLFQLLVCPISVSCSHGYPQISYYTFYFSVKVNRHKAVKFTGLSKLVELRQKS